MTRHWWLRKVGLERVKKVINEMSYTITPAENLNPSNSPEFESIYWTKIIYYFIELKKSEIVIENSNLIELFSKLKMPEWNNKISIISSYALVDCVVHEENNIFSILRLINFVTNVLKMDILVFYMSGQKIFKSSISIKLNKPYIKLYGDFKA